ncbi:MAG: AtpZ/AtpI family protein [Actinobacteria bacterium]|nr:MAG: AtpZ/AtpI family protein [Actinomycetota bacterium]
MGVGWAIASTLLAGILALGALGYLADRLIGTKDVFLPVGMVLGVAVAIYAVWLEYGRDGGRED